MKKLLALLFALMMVFSLFACGGEETADDGEEKEETKGTEATEEKEEEKTENKGNTGTEMVDVWIIEGITSAEGKLELTYDKNYNLQKIAAEISDEDGEMFKVEKQFAFNSRGQIVTETNYAPKHPDVDGMGYSSSHLYGYDGFGNEVEEDWKYFYNEKGQIVEAITSWGGTNTYTYDSNGNLILKKTDDDYGTTFTSYTYDNKGNLLEEQGDGWKCVYTYNAEGKMLTSTSSDATGTSVTWEEFREYDSNGELTKLANGYGEATFTYKKVAVTKEQAEAIEAQKAYVYDDIITMFW